MAVAVAVAVPFHFVQHSNLFDISAKRFIIIIWNIPFDQLFHEAAVGVFVPLQIIIIIIPLFSLFL